MYQLIVFLPLLGAIAAGAITLWGAHKRFPGGEAADHSHGAGAHTSHAHDDHAQGHDDHGHGNDHGPGAEGSRPAELITSGFLVAAALLSWVAFVSFWLGGAVPQRIPLLSWFASGTLAVDWALHVDTLTVVML